MYQPDLTLEEARRRIDQGHIANERIFNASSSLVMALRESRECEVRLDYARDNPELREAYQKWLDTLLTDETIEGKLIPSILTYGYGLAADDFDVDCGFFINEDFNSVIEALANAIEHGAKFCESGDVRLQFIEGNGLVVVVTDPGKGFDHEKIEFAKIDAGPKQKRGNGLTYLAKSKQFAYGTELTCDGFQTILQFGMQNSKNCKHCNWKNYK